MLLLYQVKAINLVPITAPPVYHTLDIIFINKFINVINLELTQVPVTAGT